MSISNDGEFKAALNGLSPAQQRQVAARFVENVLALCKDARVGRAVSGAKRPDVTDMELAALYQAAKAASVESFTQCGRECNWDNQAGHFVAEAAVCCVAPAGEGANPGWHAAMHARMARTCGTIATGQGTENREAETQYRILSEFANR